MGLIGTKLSDTVPIISENDDSQEEKTKYDDGKLLSHSSFLN